MLLEEGKKIGLVINISKCELITDDEEVVVKFKAFAPGIQHVTTASARLLGAPIGSHESVRDVLTTKLQELQRLSYRVGLLSAHDALFLLRNCFAIPKLTYNLRSAPCFLERQLLINYDAVIRSTLQSILNITLSDEGWEQATLPIANGGLGIRRAMDIAVPAFLSSVAGSQSLIHRLLPHNLHNSDTNDPTFIAALTEWQSRTKSAPVQPPFSSSQKFWDAPLVIVQEMKVLSAAPDQAGKARLIAAAAPHSGAFLNVYPCSSLGTRLDNSSLRIVVALRLGAPVCLPHVCVCGMAVDSSGRHGLSRRKSAGRLSRHNAVNDLIKRALMSADVPSRLEPKSLAQHDDRRPDGLSLMPWSNGRCLAWDFTCPDTLAPSHLNTAITGQGAVANEAEAKKKSKYACLLPTFDFIPIAVETMGSLGDEACAFMHQLGRRIMSVTGERRATEFLLQRLSVAIQRGNASCVLGTINSAKDCQNLDVVFYL